MSGPPFHAGRRFSLPSVAETHGARVLTKITEPGKNIPFWALPGFTRKDHVHFRIHHRCKALDLPFSVT